MVKLNCRDLFLTINYYSTKLITKLISSIQFSRDSLKTIIINNSPEDDSSSQKRSYFIKEAGTNLGFGNACNLGLSWIYAQDPQAIVWIVNPDAYLLKTSVDKVSLFFEISRAFNCRHNYLYAQCESLVCWRLRKTGTIMTQKF